MTKPKRIVLDCQHAGTMLSCYWQGSESAHIQVPVQHNTTMSQLRRDLHKELSQGFVSGNDERTRDDSGDIGDAWYKAAHAAIDRDVKLKEQHSRKPFGDLQAEPDENADSVYAFFVFKDRED